MTVTSRVRELLATGAFVVAIAGALAAARMDAGLAGPWVLVALASALPL